MRSVTLGSVFAIALAAASLMPERGNARTFKVVYDFCAKANCADGSYAGPLTFAGPRTFYGTTGRGGAHNEGVVFKMVLNQTTGKAALNVIHDFCAKSGEIDCGDGANPYTTLVRDKFGNLFGVTVHGGVFCASGGALGCGTVFGLFYNTTTKTYQHKVLHIFCGDHAGCADGSFPAAGLKTDSAGNLYGVTSGGGTNGDYGTVFKMAPANAARTRWSFKVLYKFCNNADCHDGTMPFGGLAMDGAGNLYGTTFSHGSHFEGVVFALMFNKSTGKYTFQVLHNFCAKTDCTDGATPTLSLTLDGAGSLYGTTRDGGTHNSDGTVFKLTPNAAKTAWTHKVIYNFCAQAGCADGDGPFTDLAVDQAGNLIGASAGAPGNSGGGAIFQLTPNAAKTAYSFKILRRFCTENNCADGTFSGDTSGLTVDDGGNLFLPLLDRGAHGFGSIVELVND